jgi:hypothetical protein
MTKKAAATAEPEISQAKQADTEELAPELNDPPEDAVLADQDDLDDGAEEEPEAAGLEELGAAELNMLTEDEAAEALRVDEAAEVESLRKAELALQNEGEKISADEFVCTSCFLMKRTSQLANKSKKICKDCAA